MDIYKTDIADILKELPRMEKIEYKSCDIFVCTLGFEERTHHIFTHFAEKELSRNMTLVLIKYPTNKADNETNMHQFEKLKDKIKNIEIIEYSRHNYSRELEKKLSSLIKEDSRICFDISTCSSYILYPTLKYLLESNVELLIAYSEADIYYPIKEEWEEVAKKAGDEVMFSQEFENASFLSVGVDDVYPCQIFSEMNPGNRPTILIAMPNFSAIRMNSIISRDREINKTPYERIYWLIGEPPAEKNKWRIEAVKRTNNIGSIRPPHLMKSTTLMYNEVLNKLEDIWIENKHNYHITIASLGSKMQHLATFIFMYLHKDTSLWLSEPKEFQAGRFSKGYGKAWQINIGDTKMMRDKLNTYMKFKWNM